jgi:hypothetical protein
MAKFNFTVDDDNQLESIGQVTGRKKKADVVRDALSVYAYLVTRIREGDRLFVGRDHATARELAVSTLERARPSKLTG